MDVMAWNVLDARYPCFLFLAHILPRLWGLTPFFLPAFYLPSFTKSCIDGLKSYICLDA